MNIADIFKDAHGEIHFDEVIRLIDVPGKQPPHFDHIVQLLDAKAEGFYYQPQSFLTPYFYYDDFFFFPFTVLDASFLQEQLGQEYSEVKRFQAQRAWFLKKFEQKQYSDLIHLQDKRIRFKLYQELFPQLPQEEKFSLFLDVYSSAEYGFERLVPLWIQMVFESRFQDPNYVPFSALFPELGKEVTIYRGVASKSTPLEHAYSWTLKPSVAHFFSTRFQNKGTVLQATVNVEHIVAYIPDRGEEEVLVLPEHVQVEEEFSC